MFLKKNNERSIPSPPKGRGFLDRGLMNLQKVQEKSEFLQSLVR